MNLTKTIEETLSLIKEQTGIRLSLCEHFTGVRNNNDVYYFNVVLKDRISESKEYTQLIRFSDKFKTIKVAPNGLKRIAIYPLNIQINRL